MSAYEAPRTNEEARELFKQRIEDAKLSGSGNVGKGRTLAQFVGGRDSADDDDAQPQPTPIRQGVAQKVRAEPLAREIDVTNETVRTTINLHIAGGAVRRFDAFDVPFLRADELVFYERQIGELRRGYPDCKTIQETRDLTAKIAALLEEEVKMIIPDMSIDVLRTLGRRAYDQVVAVVERIGGETLGLYDLTDAPASDPKVEAVADAQADTTYPHSDR